MSGHELNNEYFEWMSQFVSNANRYRALLQYLHSVDFTYTIPLDGNRAEDGVELRYRFGHEHGYDSPFIASYLDDSPCSILEMMVALAIRCEEHIMGDPEIGDRTGQWFWEMIENLGLASMRDDRFDETYVDDVIDRFLNREYERNGKGGLFVVSNCNRDLRSMEIWYQMCWYLDDIL